MPRLVRITTTFTSNCNRMSVITNQLFPPKYRLGPICVDKRLHITPPKRVQHHATGLLREIMRSLQAPFNKFIVSLHAAPSCSTQKSHTLTFPKSGTKKSLIFILTFPIDFNVIFTIIFAEIWPSCFGPNHRRCNTLDGRSASILARARFCMYTNQDPF